MSSSVQPVTFYVPVSASEPVEVRVHHSGLRMVLVNRDSVGLLGEDWRTLGVYFLLGPADDNPDRFRAYVGEVGKRDLLTRVHEHVAQKPWWSRALLITSEAKDGLNSAEIGWLEGRFYDVLNNAVAAEVMNKGRPGDNSIGLKDRGVLERYVEPVMAALRACGAPPDTVDQKSPPKGKKRTYYRESVKDLIDAYLLKVGTVLQPLRKNLTTTALVLPDGSLDVGGATYAAVSTAAVAVSGSKSEPGWEFWGAPSGDGGFVPLFKLRDLLRAEQPAGGASPLQPSAAHASSESAPSMAKKKQQIAGSVADLVAAGLLSVGEELRTTRRGRDDRAVVLPGGAIRMGSTDFASLSGAAKASSGNSSEPGWEYWAVERAGTLVALARLRLKLHAADVAPATPSE